TGGAGFIGSHVVEALLARGDAVTVVDDFNDFYDPAIKRRTAASFADRARVEEADIRDPARLRPLFQSGHFAAVVHLAARGGVRPSLAQPLLYTDVNIVGTQTVLTLACEFGVPKFVFASSSSVYGVNQKVPFAETDLIQHPISYYAATKLAGEAFAHVCHHLHGIDVACLRLFTVYGPRQRPDLAIHAFTRAIAAGQPIDMFGDGSTRRDYTDITDTLQGILAGLDRPLGFEIINLGEARTVPLRELIGLIETALGTRAIIRPRPSQPGDVPITCADIAKARRLLDYNPRVPIEAGIPRFVDWFRRSQ
ncbi:GDP-mannose 4,6-dehydratase, partial [bacterium]|nr:GDP-mannose 4,6-dehydratase [bacterium]